MKGWWGRWNATCTQNGRSPPSWMKRIPSRVDQASSESRYGSSEGYPSIASPVSWKKR